MRIKKFRLKNGSCTYEVHDINSDGKNIVVAWITDNQIYMVSYLLEEIEELFEQGNWIEIESK